MHDARNSRFSALPGAMHIPPATLYPTRPIPYLWRVVLELARDDQGPRPGGRARGTTLTVRWEGYASTSTEATARAIEWLQDEAASIADSAGIERRGVPPAQFRVLEVLQAAI